MDRVQQIAAAIADLTPEERKRLFHLLADGEANAPTAVPARTDGVGAQHAAPLRPAGPARPPDYLLVFDGGSKGNPGLGYGSYAITRVQDGAQRLERLQLGDDYTNNEAEYDTLIAALRDLLDRITEAGREPQEFSLEIRGDSALVIHQLSGKWQAKEPRMRERRDQCLRLLRRFGAFNLKAQPRKESVRVLGH